MSMGLLELWMVTEGAAWSSETIMVFSRWSKPYFPHVADAEGAELLACRRGLKLAHEAQVQRLVLETESVGMAAKLLKVDQDRSFNGPLVEEVKNLLRSFDVSSVRAVRRTTNEVAHVLAKLGCENKISNSWFGLVHAAVENHLVLDSVSV
jgi:ribonuclease HI